MGTYLEVLSHLNKLRETTKKSPSFWQTKTHIPIYRELAREGVEYREEQNISSVKEDPATAQEGGDLRAWSL